MASVALCSIQAGRQAKCVPCCNEAEEGLHCSEMIPNSKQQHTECISPAAHPFMYLLFSGLPLQDATKISLKSAIVRIPD